MENTLEVSLDEIMNSHHTLIEIENQNKIKCNSLDFAQLKTVLYKWASQDYPDSFLAYSFPITTPPVNNSLYNCSDGIPRNIWDYVQYCIGSTIAEWLNTYQGKMNGIKLSFSVSENPYCLNIHVSR